MLRVDRTFAALAASTITLAASSASAFVWPVSAPTARLRIHSVRVVVAAPEVEPGIDVWSIGFEVSGNGRAGLLFPLTDAEPARPTPDLQAILDRLDHATAPRIVERPPWDPCDFGVGQYARVYPRTVESPWAFGPIEWTARWPSVVEPAMPPDRADWIVVQIEARSSIVDWLQGQGLGVAAGAPPIATRAAGLLSFEPSAKPRWTPPVQIRRPRSARELLDLSPLGSASPPGRLQHVDLYTLAGGTGLTPSGPLFQLPTEVALPEIAFEQPEDTRNVIARQIRVLEGQAAVVRAYRSRGHRLAPPDLERLGAPPDATVARFALVQGSNGRPPIALASTPPGTEILEPLWFIHRPWRAPMTCAGRVGYLAAVAKQQAHVLRTFANMTGRPMPSLIAQMRDRGYLLDPFDRLDRVDPDDVRLRRVEVDRSQWR